MAGRLLYIGDNPIAEEIAKRANDEIVSLETLIKHIQDALGTVEEGDVLVEIARNAHNTITYHIEQLQNAQVYAESLKTEIQKYELGIADHQQKVIDAESRNTVLKTTNEALEKQLIKMNDVKRQLDTIRSYKLFKMLSLSKKTLRRITGRK